MANGAVQQEVAADEAGASDGASLLNFVLYGPSEGPAASISRVRKRPDRHSSRPSPARDRRTGVTGGLRSGHRRVAVSGMSRRLRMRAKRRAMPAA